ncbi:MAG TPA: hypothetical protein VHV77_01585, partial [Pirellulales bacterium]|nr:hypothetical protein [Pirellulales bacterium]
MTRLLSAIQQLEAEGAMTVPLAPGATPEVVVPQRRAATAGKAAPSIDAYAPTADAGGPPKASRRAPADLFPDAHSAEAYRGIARQLARRLTSTSVRSIGVVTADANGDASEIATLLAAALADVQQVTVLSVGAERGASDMRVDGSRLATVGHVLSGAASWEDAIHSTSVIALSTARLLRDDKQV